MTCLKVVLGGFFKSCWQKCFSDEFCKLSNGEISKWWNALADKVWFQITNMENRNDTYKLENFQSWYWSSNLYNIPNIFSLIFKNNWIENKLEWKNKGRHNMIKTTWETVTTKNSI